MTDYGFRGNAGSSSSAIKLRIYFWNPSLLLDAAVVEWDASEIDPDADMYMLHRVQKSQLMKEKKLAARQSDDAAESRFK